MSTDIEQLKMRRRELCGGSVTVPCVNVRDDLAIVFKLMSEKKPVTPQTILLKKMQVMLPTVPQPCRIFCQAVTELYGDRIASGAS